LLVYLDWVGDGKKFLAVILRSALRDEESHLCSRIALITTKSAAYAERHTPLRVGCRQAESLSY
jgi:hypothetical protein